MVYKLFNINYENDTDVFTSVIKTDVFINIFSVQSHSILARFELFYHEIWNLDLHLNYVIPLAHQACHCSREVCEFF